MPVPQAKQFAKAAGYHGVQNWQKNNHGESNACVI
jgi:hypothetical protein